MTLVNLGTQFSVTYHAMIDMCNSSVRSDHGSVHQFCLMFILLCITGTGRRRGSFDSGFVEEVKGEW